MNLDERKIHVATAFTPGWRARLAELEMIGLAELERREATEGIFYSADRQVCRRRKIKDECTEEQCLYDMCPRSVCIRVPF